MRLRVTLMVHMLVVVVATIASSPALAQNTERESWTERYNNEESNDLGLWQQTVLNYNRGKWMAEVDINPRLQYRINRLNEFHLRGFVGYRPRPWLGTWLGCYAYAPVLEPSVTNEFRLLQQVAVEKPIKRFAVSLRGRLEQRFLAHNNDQTSWRFRVMPRLNYFIDEKDSIYLFVADELFVNLNTISNTIRHGIGQNRLYAGVGFKIARETRMEVAYLNQWIHRRYHVNDQPNRFNHNIMLNLIKNF
jgi:hypothetical protein